MYIHYVVWDEITYSLPNFNGATIEVWEWISNFIPHFTGHVITYPCCETVLVKGPTDVLCTLSLHSHTQIINSLWPGDTIWWHRSRSTLAQVMASCLMAPYHYYLNQCWLIISEVLWFSSSVNFTGNVPYISYMSLKIINALLQPHLPGANELTHINPMQPWNELLIWHFAEWP